MWYIYFERSQQIDTINVRSLGTDARALIATRQPPLQTHRFAICRLTVSSSLEMQLHVVLLTVIVALLLQLVSGKRMWNPHESAPRLINVRFHYVSFQNRSGPIQCAVVRIHVRCRQNHRTGFHHRQDRSECEFQMGRSPLRGAQVSLTSNM